jgi:hypothetical protein
VIRPRRGGGSVFGIELPTEAVSLGIRADTVCRG